MHDHECRYPKACLVLISASLQSSHALECLYCGQMYQMHKTHPAHADGIKSTMITILSSRLALQSHVTMSPHLQPCQLKIAPLNYTPCRSTCLQHQ